jgi:hypothetical protein
MAVLQAETAVATTESDLRKPAKHAHRRRYSRFLMVDLESGPVPGQVNWPLPVACWNGRSGRPAAASCRASWRRD